VVRKGVLAFLLFVACCGLLGPGIAGAAPKGETPKGTPAGVRVFTNQSVVFDAGFAVKRISVARPEIADVVVVSPRQMLIVGKAPGTTTLAYWNEAEVPTTTNVVVGVDVDTVRAELEKIAPEETFDVVSSGNSLILSGTVSTERVKNRMVEAAKVFARSVVDLLKVAKLEQVLLQIRVAEINRTLAKELGMSVLFQPIINGGQYRSFLSPPGSFNAFSGSVRDLATPDAAFNDLTNVFVATPDHGG